MSFQLIKIQVTREIWENKIRLIYTPAIASLLLFLLFVFTLFSTHPSRNIWSSAEANMVIGKLGGFTSSFININSIVLLLLGTLLLVAYAHACLFDDRKHRDILFWRSLPLSEITNVLSKLAIIFICSPLLILVLNVTIGFLVLCGEILIQLLIGKTIGAIASAIDFYQIAITIGKMILLNQLVLLLLMPAIGFMLLMSAWAKRSPMLLSVSIPTALILLDAISQKLLGLNLHIIDAFATSKKNLDLILAYSFEMQFNIQNSLLLSAEFLLPFALSIGVGCTFVVAAIWLRNNRHEI